ncbi:MAG TPA: metalloregulator ArsR/SmtB family transcription factor [Vicinamibacterales bacterium]|nr:metalloregulator ArsR/SmtB family transcription factor [Vicinamibacterales bacterium]
MKAARVLPIEREPAESILDHMAILSDALRCRMLLVLERHELTVSELCGVLQLPQSTVSRHLKTLSDAGWVTSRRDGTSRYYSMTVGELDQGAQRLWPLIREQVAGASGADHDDRRLKTVLARRRSKSEEFFSSAAGQWDRLREEMFGRAFHLHALLALLDSSATVGDLGCGTGQLSALVAPHVGRVIAVDSSSEMRHAARARLADHHNVEIRLGNLEALPIDNAQLDIAMLGLVLHHVPDPALALADAGRALRASGRVLIIDMLPHDRAEYQQQMGHVWLGFPEAPLRRMLTAAGFDNVRIHALPVDEDARGPALFAAVGTKQ